MVAGVPFSEFIDGENVEVGDQVVGLRDGQDTRFDFPGDGIKDANGKYLLKYQSVGANAVNHLLITNSITGEPILLIPTGSDLNAGIAISARNGGDASLIAPGSGSANVVAIGNGDVNVILTGLGDFNITTNTGHIVTNGTDPYNAVSDDVTLSADSSITLPTQHAVKTYVDGHVATSNFFISTLVATTTNLSATYDNGTAGVGATLTATSNGAASIDDVSLALGNIVLFKNQTAALQNGVYVVIQVGDGGSPAIYERYIYFDDSAEIKQGYTTFTVEGTTNAKKGYQVVSIVNTIGVDDIDYQQLTIPTLGSSTDDAIVRFDGTSGGQIQNSGITITDANILNGAAQINVDNLRLDGNTLSTTDVNGDLTIEPNGLGAINLDSNEVFISEALIHAGDANNNLTFGTDTQTFNMGGATQLDLDSTGLRIGGANSRVDRILDDVTLSADSATALPTQHAVKTYVDSQSSSMAEGYFNGSILEVADFQVSSDGAIITATLEQDGGGDLSLFFSTGIYVLDCTPAASVALTAGTDTVPVLNYVYVPISTKVLTKSTSGWPAEEYIPIATVLCETAATFQTDGAYTVQNLVNDIVGDLESGHGSHLDTWIQSQYPQWISGVSISVLANIGVFSISTTSGTVRGLHVLSYPAFNTATGSHVYVPNYTVTPYYRTTDLRTITFTAGGGSLADTIFNLVVWGAVGVDGTQLYINVPSGSYTTLTGAIKDINRTAVFDFPSSFQGTGFLIARLTIQYQSGGGGQWTLRNSEDLRGLNPATAEGANWGFMGALSDDPEPSLSGDLLTAGNDIHAQGSDLTIVVDTEQLFLDANDVYIPQDLIHTGDTDNKITFGTDTQNFQTGGSSRMDLSDTGMRLGGADARVTSILTDDQMLSASNTNIYTGLAIKTYVDNSVIPLYDASYITSTDETSQLPNSIALSGLATGILASTTTTGALTTRIITGTANQINVANGNGSGDPTFTLSSTVVMPGTLTLGGTLNVSTFTIASSGANNLVLNAASGQTLDLQENSTSRMDITSAGVRMGATGARVTSISTDGTLSSNSDTLLSTQKAIKTYVDANSGGVTTSEVTGTSQSMAVNNRYIANNAALVTLTLPTTAVLGDFVEVRGKGAGLFKIAQNASQLIRWVSSVTTTGTGGSLTALERYDAIRIECITANTDWEVVYNTGAYTIV